MLSLNYILSLSVCLSVCLSLCCSTRAATVPSAFPRLCPCRLLNRVWPVTFSKALEFMGLAGGLCGGGRCPLALGSHAAFAGVLSPSAPCLPGALLGCPLPELAPACLGAVFGRCGLCPVASEPWGLSGHRQCVQGPGWRLEGLPASMYETNFCLFTRVKKNFFLLSIFEAIMSS